MLVTFSSKVDADVLMMADHAKMVLKAAGKDISEKIPERGVFTAEQLDGAISKIEHAISNEEPMPEPDEDDEVEETKKTKEFVLLQQRAYPLLAMMRKAKLAQESIMWETSSGW